MYAEIFLIITLDVYKNKFCIESNIYFDFPMLQLWLVRAFVKKLGFKENKFFRIPWQMRTRPEDDCFGTKLGRGRLECLP